MSNSGIAERLAELIPQASCLIVALVFSSAIMCGCFPYHGHAQLEISSTPVQFIDERTGEIIADVLVLPRYSSGSGVSTGAGHGPGAMDSTFFVASPFVYRTGDEFHPMQPKSSGLIVGPGAAFLGTGRTIDGVLIVAPGYASRFMSDLWSRRPEEFALTPLATSAAVAELGDIQRLLDLEIVNGDGKLRWSLGGNYALYMKLTDNERQLTSQFITQGLAKLNDQRGP